MLRDHGILLKKMYESEGPRATCEKLRLALTNGELQHADFSFREIAEAFMGPDWVRGLDPHRAPDGLVRVQEDAVDSTAFANISGQLMYSAVLEGYREADQGLFDQLCTTIPTRLSGEKIPGIGSITDEEYEVPEGMPFPETQIGEDYQETPATTKRGEIISLTKEAIFFDRTGILLRQAGRIGERQATGRLKRLIKVIVGAVNNYKWRGTSYNTYLTSGSWINKIVSHTIADWTDFEDLEILWEEMTEPDTGNPIVLGASKQVLCTLGLSHTIRQILNATEVRDKTNSGNRDTLKPNTLQGWQPPIVSSFLYQLLKSELSFSSAEARGTMIAGEFKKAFAYMENWPITVIQAPPNSPAEFERDIVQRWRCSERGVAAVWNPRYVIFSQPQA